MADELKRVGLVFTSEGTVDFKKSITEVNSAIRENYSEFKLAKSQWDENTTAMQKLSDEQNYLTKTTKDYTDKVKLLQMELDDLESKEERNEDAIHKKKAQLNQAKTSLNNYQKKLDEVEDSLKSGTSKIKEYTQKLDDFSDKASSVGDNLSGVSTAAAGVLAGATALVPATEEYRKIMASLEQSSQLAGYTAEQTKETYTQLFGVLGDDQSAATTTANLQALGLSQEQITELTNGTIGAWAKYGDSIPIDGLAEAINHTVQLGEVQGTMADVLEWAGITTDDFNAKLALCSTESERADLIMQELASQGLTKAGEKWQENNKNLVEGNEATAKMQDATAELADTIAPIITEVTEIVAGLLEKFNALPDSAQAVIGVVIVLVAAASILFSVISKVSAGISAFTGFVNVAAPALKALWAVFSANPIGIVITIVTALIGLFVTLYNKCEWFRDGVNRMWSSLKESMKSLKDWFIGLFDFEWKMPKIKIPHFKIDGEFSLAPPSIPKFSVSWYAKGGILNSPTIFGMSGNNLLGGGEAGHEAVLPIELLRQYIREENDANNSTLVALIREAMTEVQFVAENNIYIGDKKLETILTEMVLKKISEKMSGSMRVQGVKV